MQKDKTFDGSNIHSRTKDRHRSRRSDEITSNIRSKSLLASSRISTFENFECCRFSGSQTSKEWNNGNALKKMVEPHAKISKSDFDIRNDLRS